MSEPLGNTSVVTTPEQQRALERFYHYEARLLDSRQYQQWLALLCPDIRYTMPARVNVQFDNRERGSEAMLAIEKELESPDSTGCPVREEGYIHLMLRAERAFKINSWSENPPSRTRRLIANVELMEEGDNRLCVYSNFHLYYARPGSENFIYSGQRRDELQRDEAAGSFVLAQREVIMDYATIELPTLGLLF
jgi:3-phenylpropionate/cinnamic acid dioxygenase small subunit